MKCYRCQHEPCRCPDGQTVYVGDCREVLRLLPDESVDAVVTDPPYGLEFMGKEWDHGVPGKEFWGDVIRVAKPGAHLLAFGGTRTFHRLTVAIEDAGWEIRDCIMWVYGSGFPKSLDVSKAIDKEAGATRPVVGSKRTNVGMQGGNFANKCSSGNVDITAAATAAAAAWNGWGTALKPAWEPIIVARKPLAGSVAKNVQKHGTGAINIDGCRVTAFSDNDYSHPGNSELLNANGVDYGWATSGGRMKQPAPAYEGRFPANVIHDGSEEVVELFPSEAGAFAPVTGSEPSRPAKNTYGEYARGGGAFHGDSGSAARFFYCAKALGTDRGAWNTHPTVKPQELMAYLVKLVAPIGSTVLDPFVGSGTTLQVARKNGCRGIGIELNPEYAKLVAKRLEQRTLFTH